MRLSTVFGKRLVALHSDARCWIKDGVPGKSVEALSSRSFADSRTGHPLDPSERKDDRHFGMPAFNTP